MTSTPARCGKDAEMQEEMMRPGREYEGYVKYSGQGEVYSVQCATERHCDCPQLPDEEDTGVPPGYPLFNGCYCECSCGHEDEAGAATGPSLEAIAADPGKDGPALEAIAEMLRDPQWGAGMLEDIAELVRGTGRTVDDYPDRRSTWARH